MKITEAIMKALVWVGTILNKTQNILEKIEGLCYAPYENKHGSKKFLELLKSLGAFK